jgi:hypothetical protein
MSRASSECEQNLVYDPTVLNATAIELAAGNGRNGGRYVPDPESGAYVEWDHLKARPADHPDFGR